IGDDELALFGREVAVGHVNGNALLPLCLEAVGEQRQVDLRSLLSSGALDRRELVLGNAMRVVQQATNQGGLAVIDLAHRDEAAQLFLLVQNQVFVDVAFDEFLLVHPRSTLRASWFPCSPLRRNRSVDPVARSTWSTTSRE